MAREICFCGWVGELEDREPVYASAMGAGLPHVRPPRPSGGLVGGGPRLDIGRGRTTTGEHGRNDIGSGHYDEPPQAAARSLPPPPAAG